MLECGNALVGWRGWRRMFRGEGWGVLECVSVGVLECVNV